MTNSSTTGKTVIWEENLLKKVARRGTSATLLPFFLIIETPMAQFLHTKIHTFFSDGKHENVTSSLNVPYMGSNIERIEICANSQV